MAKILGSWSGMRKYLEQEMLAKSLEGRIRYGCTSYSGMDGCRIFEICIDGKQFKRFSWETVNSYFIEKGLTENKEPVGKQEYWAEFWSLLEKYPMSEREEYTDEEFANALERYRNCDIGESLCSEDPLVMMFALLDRRAGKRTISALWEKMAEKPTWLLYIYNLRVEAEGIRL